MAYTIARWNFYFNISICRLFFQHHLCAFLTSRQSREEGPVCPQNAKLMGRERPAGSVFGGSAIGTQRKRVSPSQMAAHQGTDTGFEAPSHPPYTGQWAAAFCARAGTSCCSRYRKPSYCKLSSIPMFPSIKVARLSISFFFC